MNTLKLINKCLGKNKCIDVKYNLSSTYVDKGVTKKYDPKQIKIGTKVELEHTKDKKLAATISRDHLREFPNYYTGLVKLEKELSRKRK